MDKPTLDELIKYIPKESAEDYSRIYEKIIDGTADFEVEEDEDIRNHLCVRFSKHYYSSRLDPLISSRYLNLVTDKVIDGVNVEGILSGVLNLIYPSGSRPIIKQSPDFVSQFVNAIDDRWFSKRGEYIIDTIFNNLDSDGFDHLDSIFHDLSDERFLEKKDYFIKKIKKLGLIYIVGKSDSKRVQSIKKDLLENINDFCDFNLRNILELKTCEFDNLINDLAIVSFRNWINLDRIYVSGDDDYCVNLANLKVLKTHFKQLSRHNDVITCYGKLVEPMNPVFYEALKDKYLGVVAADSKRCAMLLAQIEDDRLEYAKDKVIENLDEDWHEFIELASVDRIEEIGRDVAKVVYEKRLEMPDTFTWPLTEKKKKWDLMRRYMKQVVGEDRSGGISFAQGEEGGLSLDDKVGGLSEY